MSPEDIIRCQQAINLANTPGQKQVAYMQFCELYSRNINDVTLLYWLAYTTLSREEAQRAIGTIASLEPMHPKLQELQAYVSKKQYYVLAQPAIGPALHCPYCHFYGPAHIEEKTSVGGWVCFGIMLVLFFPLCWIGLLIKRSYYTCGSCAIALGDIH